MQYTFSTGRTVEVIPISPWVLEAVRESVPWPEPPKQTVDGPDGPVEVVNTSHPEYLKALEARRQTIVQRQQQLIVLEGTAFEIDQAAVDKRRATLKQLGVTLPPEADDDRHFYLYYICVGSDQDQVNLARLIQGLSIVGEEAVAAATESF